GVAVRTLAPRLQQDVLAVDELFDDVPSAVGGVGGIAVRGPYVGIHRGQPAAYAYSVELDAFHADGWFAVAEVDECPGGTHGSEGSGGHYIHLFGNLFRRHRAGELRHLLGSQDDRFAVLDTFVYLLVCFRHGKMMFDSAARHAALRV